MEKILLELPIFDSELSTLDDSEQLLAINRRNMAMMSPLNKDGSVNGDFKKYAKVSPIYIIDEIPRENWKIEGCERGASQMWCIVKHSFGF